MTSQPPSLPRAWLMPLALFRLTCCGAAACRGGLDHVGCLLVAGVLDVRYVDVGVGVEGAAQTPGHIVGPHKVT